MKTYLMEVSMIWLAFLSLYWILLRREKLLVSNRWYLLLSLSLGLVLPLVPLPSWGGETATTFEAIDYWLAPITINAMGNVIEPIQAAGIDWLAYLFILGCVLTALRLGYGLWQLMGLLRKAKIVRRHGVLFALLPKNLSPFSWGPYLFWSEENGLNQKEEAAVIAHEKAHIRQGHSWDILYLELIGILFWWNPLWYAYRYSLRNVHEYLADAAASRGVNLRQYGKLLLRQALNPDYPRISHAFHSSTIKSRIAMLTKTENGRQAAWKYLLVLPLLALVVYACSSVDGANAEEMKQAMKEYEFIEQVDTIITFNPENYTETVEIVSSKVYKEVEQMPVFGSCPNLDGDELMTCSQRNMLEYIYANIKYPKSAREANVEGTVVARIYINEKGEVGRAEILKSVASSEEMKEKRTVVVVGAGSEEPKALGDAVQKGIWAIDAEVERVIESMPNWQPGTINGEPVQVMLALPVQFKIQ